MAAMRQLPGVSLILAVGVYPAAALAAPGVSKLLRGKRVDRATAADLFRQGCTGKCQGDMCELFCGDEADQVKAAGATVEASSKCSCSVDDELCSCTPSCSSEDQRSTCVELLGECMCGRSSNAYCECSGYCHTLQERQEACDSSFGCGWTGSWCDVVSKLKFNEETDELEASFLDQDDAAASEM
eukprot:TRINITY_DN9463_c0_g1_i1.p1 TRINITY_DN9463_c0_g1~~TRINITY_DN9463_c0_g1_i1.p1  ORF type:complete len:185 (+),score=47.20 TRINITY_DN9463_c0_g1_i1:140-694(+)